MKSYALISMASDDWFVAEQYRNRAEHIYATETNKLPRGTKLDKDFVNMRNELDELAQFQLENEPAEDQEEPTTEPLPQNLRVQYLLEDCEDADEIYNDNDLAAYADALQQILESGSVNWEIAEVLWEEQESEWDSQMPPDVDSFMQATRHALDSLSKNHQDAAATDAETVSQAGNTSTFELLQTERHDPERPTISGIPNPPIRVAGIIPTDAIKKEKKKKQDPPRKVRYDERSILNQALISQSSLSPRYHNLCLWDPRSKFDIVH
ncbi:hypothetical protein KCU71_g9367, partial [Aureobasidium melanogenum]